MFAATTVVPRRLLRDAGLVTCWVALVAVSTMLALILPGTIVDTADAGAREAVAAAGASADISVRGVIGDPDLVPDAFSTAEFLELADRVPDELPAAISAVSTLPTTAVTSADLPVSRPTADRSTPRLITRLGMLGPDQERALTVTDGRLPGATDRSSDRFEVAVSRGVADAAAVDVGTVLRLPGRLDGTSDDTPRAMVVVGIVDALDETEATDDPAVCAPEWCDAPGLWHPVEQTTNSGLRTVRATVLVAPDTLDRTVPLFTEPLDGVVRFRLTPSVFTSDLVERVSVDAAQLRANSRAVSAASPHAVSIRTDFDEALAGFSSTSAAAIAQMSLLVAGVYGLIVATVVLLATLLAARRRRDVGLERARGASLVSIGGRVLLESVILAAVAGALGWSLAGVFGIDATPVALPLVAIAGSAVVVPTALAVASARNAWHGRREPANKRDRDDIRRGRRLARLIAETAVVVVTVAALVSVRSRGVVEARADGIDPLLASAPLLLAITIALVVVRVFPPVVRAVARLASRSRGVTGVVAAAHATRATALLPLIALTVAVGIAVSGGLLVSTVRAGQESASWERVGADVRVDGPLDGSVVSEVADAAGVDAVSAQVVRSGVEVDSGPGFSSATVVAIDDRYGDVVRRLPADRRPSAVSANGQGPGGESSGGESSSGGSSGAEALTDSGAPFDDLTALSDSTGASDPVPVLVDSQLASRMGDDDVVVRYDDESISVEVVGVINMSPVGFARSPFLFVDLEALESRLPDALERSTLLVMGDGAPAAVAAVAAVADDDHTVVARSSWLADRRELAFVGGVETIMIMALGAAGVLGAVAVVATTAAGSRERARSLALLRTLGVPRRFGWWLAGAQLVPLAVAAVLGGSAAGVIVVTTIGPALGLQTLAGGTSEPPLHLDGLTVAGVAGATITVLAIALVVDAVIHRRDRLSDVLRVGETT